MIEVGYGQIIIGLQILVLICSTTFTAIWAVRGFDKLDLSDTIFKVKLWIFSLVFPIMILAACFADIHDYNLHKNDIETRLALAHIIQLNNHQINRLVQDITYYSGKAKFYGLEEIEYEDYTKISAR